MQTVPFDWESEVRGWSEGQGGIDAALVDSAVAFFRLAFQNMQCRDRAWFGCHETLVSAVVGGIFLAAITRAGSDPGVWLVVDQDPPQLAGVEYRPVKSTAESEHPLKWAHAAALDALPGIVRCAPLWDSFRSATAWIVTSSRSAGDRDEVQQVRGKRRVCEFWR